MTLTKVHIVEAVAEKIGYTKNRSINTIETLLELIKRSLESGEDVLISGFGICCRYPQLESRLSETEINRIFRDERLYISSCLK